MATGQAGRRDRRKPMQDEGHGSSWDRVANAMLPHHAFKRNLPQAGGMQMLSSPDASFVRHPY